MLVQIFGPDTNEDDNRKNYRMFKKLINKLRTDYLANNGIRCVGLFAHIDERWDTYAALID